MTARLIAPTAVVLAAGLVAGIAQARPPRAAPFDSDGLLLQSSQMDGGWIYTSSSGTGLAAAADNIISFQCADGGWGWEQPPCPTPTYHNITAPIALGLLHAYDILGYTPAYDSAVLGGDFDLTGQWTYGGTAFGSHTPYFFWSLSQASGDSTYSDNAATDFFDRLTAGTYGDGGTGCNAFFPGNTYDYLNRHKCVRAGGTINLRPWDMQDMPFVAGQIGNPDSSPADGISQQTTFLNDGVLDGLNTLDTNEAWDLIGLTGGVRGLALNGTTTFPAIVSPNFTAISGITSLCALADVLAGYQNANGSWYWASTLTSPDASDEDTQTTAYAVLALVEAQNQGCGPYDAEIALGRAWLRSMQDPADGGFWSQGDLSGKNTEVIGEVLSAWTPEGLMKLEAVDCQDDWDANPGNGYQIAVELWMRDLTSDVTGFQAFLNYDDTLLSYEGAMSFYDPFFFLHVIPLSAAEGLNGDLDLDGSVNFNDPGTDVDHLLATLVFTVDTECTPTIPVVFRTPPSPFESELSYQGMPLDTALIDAPEIHLDDTPPFFVNAPGDLTIECVEEADPGIAYGATTDGGVAIYYNNNGNGENPLNQAYLQGQFDKGDTDTGSPFLFSNDNLVGVSGAFFSWQFMYSGLTWPDSQFGLDLVWETPTWDGTVGTPLLPAWDYDGTVGILAGYVTWAIGDYKPHTPDIDSGVVVNSIVRGNLGADTSPSQDVLILRNDVTVSGSVYTSVIEGRLTSDGIHHWFTPTTPDSPMSNFGLNGDFYFSGTLTYDVSTDVDPLMDFYEGDVTLTANYPSTLTGVATADDNCANLADPTTWPTVSYSDADNGGSGCDGDPLIITRTWVATDACGNTAQHIQTITVEDDVPPTFLSVPADIDVNADAGVCTVTLTTDDIGMPTATDNCWGGATITWSRDDSAADLDDPFDSADSPITITWTATDGCGNTADYDQTVTVNALNTISGIPIILEGNAPGPVTRCIKVIARDTGTDTCTTPVHVMVTFSGSPATGTVSVDVDCGDWDELCVKDEQHTLYDSVGLIDSGTVYTAATTPYLLGGDTDNDSDVDINDVTWLLFQFGMLANSGGCPWDGTRDADFSNNGAVGSEDYLFLSSNWLTWIPCDCVVFMDDGSFSTTATSVSASAFPLEVASRVDLNRDNVIDYLDVEIFEDLNGLPHDLSARIRATATAASQAAAFGPPALPSSRN